jgi:hypothetical protein
MNEGTGHADWMRPGKRGTGLLKRFHRIMSRRHQAALVERGWYDLSARCDDAAIFIGGCGRSGTTVFKEMVARHPRLACGPETSLFGLPFNVNNIAAFWDLDAEVLQQKADPCRNLPEFAAWFYRQHLLEAESKA